jgi:hypothetical protein
MEYDRDDAPRNQKHRDVEPHRLRVYKAHPEPHSRKTLAWLEIMMDDTRVFDDSKIRTDVYTYERLAAPFERTQPS